MSNTIIVKNSRNQTVATIAPATVDVTTPLTLVGRGYSGAALAIAQNEYALLENYASNVAPAAPAEGMNWYDTAAGMKYWNTTTWISYATGSTTDMFLTRMPSASNINMATVASHNIHTGAAGVQTIVTGVLLVPRAGAAVSGPPPSISLEVSNNTGDVADKIVLSGLTSPTKFFRYNIAGGQRIVAASDIVKLSVKSAIQGGDTLACDVYLYGVQL
jgi:hypothetical protein